MGRNLNLQVKCRTINESLYRVIFLLLLFIWFIKMFPLSSSPYTYQNKQLT